MIWGEDDVDNSNLKATFNNLRFETQCRGDSGEYTANCSGVFAMGVMLSAFAIGILLAIG